jgi:hypothetical protein
MGKKFRGLRKTDNDSKGKLASKKVGWRKGQFRRLYNGSFLLPGVNY